MAKLSVKLSLSFATGPLIAMNHEESQMMVVIGKALEDMVKCADLSKLGFDVTLKDEVYYSFPLSSGKKGAIIEIKINDDLSGLAAKIDGVFEVKLRSGAERGLQVKKPDLRLKAVTWNGGNWNGFEARPVGIDSEAEFDDYFKLLPKIAEFELK
jgi:hypothetical protein